MTEDIEPITMQQVIDQNWDWFVVQKMPQSIDSEGNCLYRGPNGTKCGIGCVLPDELYDPSMDSAVDTVFSISVIPVTDLVRKYPLVGEFFELCQPMELSFLDRVQSAHDNHFYEIGMFLRELAKQYNLLPPDREGKDL